MTRRWRFSLAALVLIGAATLLLLLSTGREPTPVPPPRFAAFPATIGGWVASEGVPPSTILPRDSRAALQFVRTYERGGRALWIAVDYYPEQGENRRPAARQLVFPGRGWTNLQERPGWIPLDIQTGRGLPVNVVIMQTRQQTVALLYWYQLPGRSLASDHWYRALLIWNRLVHGRGDGALVRVAAPIPSTSAPADAVSALSDFVGTFHSSLLEVLPR